MIDVTSDLLRVTCGHLGNPMPVGFGDVSQSTNAAWRADYGGHVPIASTLDVMTMVAGTLKLAAHERMLQIVFARNTTDAVDD